MIPILQKDIIREKYGVLGLPKIQEVRLLGQQIRNFFDRHPGLDLYTVFWLILFFVLISIGRIFLPLMIPAAIVLVYCIIRLLSKNKESRRIENARFIALIQEVAKWFRKKGRSIQPDKEYYYFKCPTCGQPLRIPRGLGKVEIDCRACHSRFETHS